MTKSTTIEYEFSGPLVKERSSDQEIEDSQITPDSVLDSPTWKSLCTISKSTGTSNEGMVESLNSSANCTAELLQNKRSSVQLVSRIWCTTELATGVNRRKGVPHRSPLY